MTSIQKKLTTDKEDYYLLLIINKSSPANGCFCCFKGCLTPLATYLPSNATYWCLTPLATYPPSNATYWCLTPLATNPPSNATYWCLTPLATYPPSNATYRCLTPGYSILGVRHFFTFLIFIKDKLREAHDNRLMKFKMFGAGPDCSMIKGV
jgi:hypothetical protein